MNYPEVIDRILKTNVEKLISGFVSEKARLHQNLLIFGMKGI